MSNGDAVEMYHAVQTSDMPEMVVLVKTAGATEGLIPMAKSISASLDPNLFPGIRLLKEAFKKDTESAGQAAMAASLLGLAAVLLAALLTVSTSVLFRLPINYANIIALPLLLGIGVAFSIYFVMNWRAGRPDPLQSSTARAGRFSALTTVTAFGSLALSSHPGTADMGLLLSIALGWTLLATFFFLPALLGPVAPAADPHRP